MVQRVPAIVRLIWLASVALALGCGGSDPVAVPDAGPAGDPVRIDAGLRDAGTTSDAGPRDGGVDRPGICARYCQKLFGCGYLPRPGQPTSFTLATCTSQCGNLGGFPPEEQVLCVESAECGCDGSASCIDVSACFAGLTTDGG